MITIPTFQQLYNSILADLQSQFGITISTFGKVFLRAQAAVQAGKLKLFYLGLGNLQKNIFIDTAEPENLGGTLERFGRVKLGRNPFAAVSGQYVVTITGSIGAIIKAATTFKSDDTSSSPGYLFVLDADYTLVATTDTITLRALTPGIISKLIVADTLTVTSPIALVDSAATVASISVNPLDAETIEQYRSAALKSYRLEPQGGAATDYRLWSQDAQGVANTYPYAKSGAANEINLYVEATVADSTDGKGTPSSTLLTNVESVVELNPDTTLDILERGRRPLGVFQVHYLPVAIKEVSIIITGLVGRTTAIETLIENALIAAVNTIRPFVAAIDVLAEKNDIIDTNKIIATIIAQQPGAIFTSVTLKIDTVTMSTYTFVDGNIPHINAAAITFV